MNELMNVFGQVKSPQSFDSIRIAIASPRLPQDVQRIGRSGAREGRRGEEGEAECDSHDVLRGGMRTALIACLPPRGGGRCPGGVTSTRNAAASATRTS